MSDEHHRTRSLAVVILAAGQGTRMKSTLPKVLHRIGGRPLVGHVLDTARALTPQSVLVVVRHERDMVADVVARRRAGGRRRRPGRGARHGPRRRGGARRRFPDFAGDVLVLSGDVPLLDGDTLARLIRAPPRERGRRDRAERGRRTTPPGTAGSSATTPAASQRIVEQKDATRRRGIHHRDQRGRLRLPGRRRCALTSRCVGTANAQGERYLTDVVALLRDSRLAVGRLAGDGCRGRAGRERPRPAVARRRDCSTRARCAAGSSTAR